MASLRQPLQRSAHRPLIVLTLLALAGCTESTPQAGLDVAIMNRADPLPGITTSGQPDEAALQGLADAGYAAVIDLRGVDAVEADCCRPSQAGHSSTTVTILRGSNFRGFLLQYSFFSL